MEGRKRRQDGGANSNGGFKKPKQEMDSSGIGSKSKPCTKFFSTSGCPFGESCHFLHHVPGGYNAVAQLINLPTMSKSGMPPQHPQNGAAATVKTRICKRFSSAEGCKFGDKCHYAHGEWELNKPVAPSFEDHHSMFAPMPGHRYPGRNEPPPARGLASGFGESENATVKIGVDAALVGAIIGKSGVNSKQISRNTGAKLSIRDHDSNPSLKNIELQGSFDQIKMATAMVRDLVASAGGGGPTRGHGQGHGHGQGQFQGQGQGRGGSAPAYGPQSNNYKTKICENFTKGTCTFGDKCHFAHGEAELRKSGV